jgi:hypothetical protein
MRPPCASSRSQPALPRRKNNRSRTGPFKRASIQPIARPTVEPFRFAGFTLDSREEVLMTMRLILAGLLFLSTATGLSSCVVRERTVARPGGCPGGVWVEGHHGPRGRWHPGHWRCPGVVERIEID